MNKIEVFSPTGNRASPYRIESNKLIKRVQERHIFKLRQAVGIDEEVWQKQRRQVSVVRFEFPDGSVREIKSEDFEDKSFLHGDGASFAVTRFIPMIDLVQVQKGMRSFFILD